MTKRTYSAMLPTILLATSVLLLENLAWAQNISPAPKYAQLADRLTSIIQHEMKDKQIPDVAIALVDNQRVVWAQGFGWQDAAEKIPATAHTVYRVGSYPNCLPTSELCNWWNGARSISMRQSPSMSPTLHRIILSISQLPCGN